MAKARAHPDQLAFCLDAPSMPTGPAALAGLEARICATVGAMIASSGRPREVLAAEMSVMLDDDISKAMLDAYSSPARDTHRVPMSRFFALAAVTARLDLMDPLLREIGGSVLIGTEVNTARLGHLRQQARAIATEIKALEQNAPLIRGGK
ncbi:hypothetical protein J2X73_002511 [Novosphingobium sp. 1748]|uniref:hypothetical protein n=1 Tax=Novosphingobium sp. 1748 TaxID=2817760 RepID=UPI00285AA701|nr:hypothetical protein [Novosphingobium sp. 1748]MDR6708140.1 hypothetical protein [Novosphingobium sp. 1748]